jgi:hypothetical protein
LVKTAATTKVQFFSVGSVSNTEYLPLAVCISISCRQLRNCVSLSVNVKPPPRVVILSGLGRFLETIVRSHNCSRSIPVHTRKFVGSIANRNSSESTTSISPRGKPFSQLAANPSPFERGRYDRRSLNRLHAMPKLIPSGAP